MAKTIGRLKEGALSLLNEVNERLPVIRTGLTHHYPLDGYVGDIFTEQRRHNIVTTSRDWYGSYFSNYYDYSGAKFRISGRVRVTDAADWNAYTLGIGFRYRTNAAGTATVYTWPTSWRKTLSDLQDWVYFDFEQTIGTNFTGDLIPFIQISISGHAGYRAEIEDLVYKMDYESVANPTNLSTVGGSMAFEVGTTNYIGNGHFSNGTGATAESGSVGTNQVIRMPNPGDSEWVLRQTGNGGTAEYELHFKSGTSIKPNTTYTLSCWVAYSSDWNGTDQIFHARYYKSDSTETSFVGAGNLIEEMYVAGLKWQRRRLTFTTDSLANGSFNWYLGYSSANSKGYRYFTNIQIEAKDYASSFVDGDRGDGSASLIANINPINQPFTLNYWLKTNGYIGSSTANNITLGKFGNIRSYNTAGGNTVKYVWDYDASTRTYVDLTSSTHFKTDEFEMITMTWDKSKVRFYRNGTYWTERVSTTACTLGVIDKIIFNHPNLRAKDMSIYNRVLTAEEITKLYTSKMSITKDGDFLSFENKEDINYLEAYMNSYIHNTGSFSDGWSKYVQSQVSVEASKTTEHTNSDYSVFIQTTPNMTQAANGNVMWGGLRVNPPEEAKRPGKWKLSFWYKGVISQSNLDVYFAYTIGWSDNGVGLRIPARKDIPKFNTDEWQYYEFIYTLDMDDIYQVGTDGKIYDCMRELKIGVGYGSTGSRGARVFIDRVSISPVINERPGVKKNYSYFPTNKEDIKMNTIHVIGTALEDASGNPIGSGTAGNRSIKVNGKEYASNTRGLMLSIFNKNMEHLSSSHYDVYGADADRTNLANALNAIKEEESWAIASYDAIGFNANLLNQMNKMGSKIVNSLSGNARHTYAAWGKGQQILWEDGSHATALDDHKAVIKKMV
jgi:hypothetical protein